MENDQIVDISYAVSAEEAQGRKRMKNLVTGEVFWAEEILAEPVVEQKSPPDIEHFKAKAKKHGA